MKQSELEQQFEQELLQNGRKAESECGCRLDVYKRQVQWWSVR